MLQITDLVSLGKYADVKANTWVALMSVMGNPENFDDFLAIPKDMLLDWLNAFEFKEGRKRSRWFKWKDLKVAEYGPFGET